MPEVIFFEAKQGNKLVEMAEFEFCDKQKDWHLHFTAAEGQWLEGLFPQLMIGAHAVMQYAALRKSYEAAGLQYFDAFVKTRKFMEFRENGLLIL